MGGANTIRESVYKTYRVLMVTVSGTWPRGSHSCMQTRTFKDSSLILNVVVESQETSKRDHRRNANTVAGPQDAGRANRQSFQEPVSSPKNVNGILHHFGI